MFNSFYEKTLFTPITQKCVTGSKKNEQLYKIVKSDDDIFKIVIVLDESGSMENVRYDMIKSINDLIREQKQIKERPSSFTFVKFNNKINRVIKNKSLEEIDFLSKNDYNPTGTTALYDAIGDTITWFNSEKNVLMIIVTDGQENASIEFSRNQVLKMIEEKKKYDNWTYVYLSNDLSTQKQGFDIGLQESYSTTNAVVNQKHFGAYMSNNLNNAISGFRLKGTSVQDQLNSK